jgi:hypothetical protein
MDRIRLTPPVCARLALLGVLLTGLYAAGCDTLGDPGALQLSYEETFEFRVNGSQLQAGQETEVVSQNQVDLSSDLSSDGFTTAEVLSARVTSVEIERIQPLNVDLRFLSAAAFQLRAGSQTREVASRTGFPSDETADLSAQAVDVAAFIRAPVFRGVLRLTPAQVSAGDQYRLEVRVRFSVDVEGV